LRRKPDTRKITRLFPEAYEVDVTGSKNRSLSLGWMRVASGLLLAAVASGAVWAEDKAAASARIAFEFAYEDVNPNSETHGKKLALIDLYAAEGMVLNFLASWCPPCWTEAPSFAKLDGKISTPIIFIAADEHDGRRDLLARLEQIEIDQPVLIVPRNEIAMLERHYDHEMLPSTYVIDKRGEILQVFEGMISENTLVRALGRHLPESGAASIPVEERSRQGSIAF